MAKRIILEGNKTTVDDFKNRRTSKKPYVVIKAVNVLTPVVGERLDSDDVGGLIHRGIAVTIQPPKARR